VSIVIVVGLTWIEESIAKCVFVWSWPRTSLVFVALSATPIKICVFGDEFRASVVAAHWLMMIDGASGLASEKILMSKTISATELKVMSQ